MTWCGQLESKRDHPAIQEMLTQITRQVLGRNFRPGNTAAELLQEEIDFPDQDTTNAMEPTVDRFDALFARYLVSSFISHAS